MDALPGRQQVPPSGRVATGGEGPEHHAAAVAFPESRREAAEAPRFVGERGIPVVLFGRGRSPVGQTAPARGDVNLDRRLADATVGMRPGGFVVRARPGVGRGGTSLGGTLAGEGEERRARG